MPTGSTKIGIQPHILYCVHNFIELVPQFNYYFHGVRHAHKQNLLRQQ